jgi:hypothetical protein
MARAPDGTRFSVCGERVARLARPSPGRRPRIQPQVGEDLADRRLNFGGKWGKWGKRDMPNLALVSALKFLFARGPPPLHRRSRALHDPRIVDPHPRQALCDAAGCLDQRLQRADPALE